MQVKPLKDKKGKAFLNAFIKIVNESNRKPAKIWVDQGREFYNKLVYDWLENNDILMYSTHESKSVIDERFIKTLKAKIYKKMTANDSKSYLPYLNKLVDQYNNTHHHSINPIQDRLVWGSSRMEGSKSTPPPHRYLKSVKHILQ